MGAISLFQLSFQPSGAILYILVSLSMKKCSLSKTKKASSVIRVLFTKIVSNYNVKEN